MSTTHPAASEQSGRRGGDDGFAMITVVGAMFVLSFFVLAALTTALHGLPQSRRAQDSAAALAAAQGGVDDLLARLNACDTYWLNPAGCAGATANPALGGTWAQLPGSPTTVPARFQYRYVSTPEPTPGTPSTSPGMIRVESTGEVNGVRRTVSVDLRKAGFLRYIYYTDIEAQDPGRLVAQYPPRTYSTYEWRSGGTGYEVTNARFAGVTAADAERCARHWYGPSGARQGTWNETVVFDYGGSRDQTRSEPRSCDLSFAGGATPDVIKGPLHSNDALLLEGGVVFQDPAVHTSWPAGANPAPDASNWFRPRNAGDQPSTGGYRPRYADRVELPPSGTAVTRDAAVRNGCLYTGPTSVEFLDTGKLRVHSPRSTGLPASCTAAGGLGTPQIVDGPVNGVIHVQGLGESGAYPGYTCLSGEKVLGRFPETGDNTSTYDCRQGDAFVSGVVGRPLTVSAANNIVITDNVTYKGNAPDADVLTGNNVLGLIAKNSVEVYHPVGCSVAAPTTPPPGWTCDPRKATNLRPPANRTIHAAILSLEHSFAVQNYDRGAALGTLTVRGGIYQKYRGPVAVAGSSGYIKDYGYDRRLINLPPPSFIEPKVAAWSVTNFSEQSR